MVDGLKLALVEGKHFFNCRYDNHGVSLQLSCCSVFWDVKAAHIGVLQLQQLHLPRNAAGIAGQAAVCADDAVTGDHQGDRVVPNRAADGLRGHPGK